MNVLLQIFDDGIATDAFGNQVDFKNTIIIMTSNLGSDLWLSAPQGGVTRDQVQKILQAHFRPEFLNRLDDIVVFRSLTKPDLIEILDLEINKVAQRLKAKNIALWRRLRGDAEAWTVWNRYFNPEDYLSLNPDVARRGVDPSVQRRRACGGEFRLGRAARRVRAAGQRAAARSAPREPDALPAPLGLRRPEVHESR